MADVEQMKKIIPFVTCEITFGQKVCELMFGINVSNLNFRIEINPVKHPIQSNSVGSWHMSHRWTSAFDDHVDHGFIILKDIQHGIGTRMWNVIDFGQIEIGVRGWNLFSLVWLRNCRQVSLWLSYIFGFVCFVLTKSKRSSAGIPSMRKPASREITSASVEPCESEVCFLHIQLIGTNVWLPKMHNVPPDVDFEASRSPAKSESWNSPSLHCLAVFPTWQYCLYSLVWWT